MQGVFCKLFVDGDNCLELLPIAAVILHRQHHTQKWKEALKNLSETLLEWMETSPFIQASLWARPCEPCNGMSGRNQVNQENQSDLCCCFLCSFPALGFLPVQQPLSFLFVGAMAKRAACSCSLLCRWPNSVSVSLLCCSSSTVGFFFFLKSLEIKIIFLL